MLMSASFRARLLAGAFLFGRFRGDCRARRRGCGSPPSGRTDPAPPTRRSSASRASARELPAGSTPARLPRSSSSSTSLSDAAIDAAVESPRDGSRRPRGSSSTLPVVDGRASGSPYAVKRLVVDLPLRHRPRARSRSTRPRSSTRRAPRRTSRRTSTRSSRAGAAAAAGGGRRSESGSWHAAAGAPTPASVALGGASSNSRRPSLVGVRRRGRAPRRRAARDALAPPDLPDRRRLARPDRDARHAQGRPGRPGPALLRREDVHARRCCCRRIPSGSPVAIELDGRPLLEGVRREPRQRRAARLRAQGREDADARPLEGRRSPSSSSPGERAGGDTKAAVEVGADARADGRRDRRARARVGRGPAREDRSPTSPTMKTSLRFRIARGQRDLRPDDPRPLLLPARQAPRLGVGRVLS